MKPDRDRRSRRASTILPAAMIAVVASPMRPAAAQVSPDAGIEATTDENRRGLSWSEGKASLSGDLHVTRGALEAGARAGIVRNSVRHDGANAVADLTLAASWNVAAVRLRANSVAHVFAGARSKMDYVEIGGSAGYGYGPLYLTAGAAYVPSQHAIGGSNLYLFADASAGIPRTPLTAIAAIGRSSGQTDDPVIAERLRPGGDYTDWRLGLEHRRDALTIGIDYRGTDVSRTAAIGPFADARHAGNRLVGRIRLGF